MPKGSQAKVRCSSESRSASHLVTNHHLLPVSQAAKAAHQSEVQKSKSAKAEADEASKWESGSKGKAKGEDKAEKAAAQRAAKLERDRLLACAYLPLSAMRWLAEVRTAIAQ